MSKSKNEQPTAAGLPMNPATWTNDFLKMSNIISHLPLVGPKELIVFPKAKIEPITLLKYHLLHRNLWMVS